MAILHCYTYCHVKSKTPPSEVYYHNYNVCLLPITRFVNILLVEVGGFAPPSTTTFKQLLRITYCITYCDTCQGIYVILPGNVFCPL